ncbi:hypothetical protein JOF41_002831 [Saccharothrix coeruleofusca]|nr:hypothetical protein [Saccharothrix coeruleofusca]
MCWNGAWTTSPIAWPTGSPRCRVCGRWLWADRAPRARTARTATGTWRSATAAGSTRARCATWAAPARSRRSAAGAAAPAGPTAAAPTLAAHAVLAARGEWVTNEKTLLSRAGLDAVDGITARVEADPVRAAEEAHLVLSAAVRVATG